MERSRITARTMTDPLAICGEALPRPIRWALRRRVAPQPAGPRVPASMLDLAALRAEFPVLERLSYLNAGTNGPVPRRALEAAAASLREQTANGRGDPHFFKA